MANVKPSSYPRHEQLAYAVKQLRKARASLARAAKGLPQAHAAELIRLATKASESGPVKMNVPEALELMSLADDTYAVVARRLELSQGKSSRECRHQLAVEARRKYLG
jgi:hypothetical protein